VLDDAAFAESVANGVHGCMSNTGQSCNAPTRMLVPAKRHDEALDIAKAAAAKDVVGDPKAEGTVVGPLVSDMQFGKVQDLIQKGIDEGATLVCGGTGKPDDLNRGYYVKPTVFGNVTNDMTIAQEEIFGPVLAIIAYDDIDDAVEIANDTVYGLAAYVSGSDKTQMTDIARQLRAGQIHLSYAGGGTDAPFGGYKQSGNGREKAEWGLEDYLEVKAIMGAA
jgi:aldehyde dehydrogenase (NAD+)